jgi:hypothetical protein
VRGYININTINENPIAMKMNSISKERFIFFRNMKGLDVSNAKVTVIAESLQIVGAETQVSVGARNFWIFDAVGRNSTSTRWSINFNGYSSLPATSTALFWGIEIATATVVAIGIVAIVIYRRRKSLK